MEQARLILAVVLSFMVFLIWDTFFGEKAPVDPQSPKTQIVDPSDSPTTVLPEPAPLGPTTRRIQDIDQPVVRKPETASKKIVVDTPQYIAEFDEQTAGITSFKLKQYFESVGPDAPLKELVSPNLEKGTILFSLFDSASNRGEEPVFQTDVTATRILVTTTQTLSFKALAANGELIEKAYTFDPDSLKIGLNIVLINEAGYPIEQDVKLSLISRVDSKPGYGFTGSSALGSKEIIRVKVGDMEDEPRHDGKFEWIVFQERYFITALVPTIPAEASMMLAVTGDKRAPEKTIETSYLIHTGKIGSGSRKTIGFDLVMAPKSFDLLGKVGNNLQKTVHFGFFDIIAKPCLWLMNRIYDFIPNYGIAIILLTIFIKILFWPLGNKSYKSMNEMKKLQPLMAEIREKYKNDKTKMNQEMMGLYKTYKINPLGGCLPMLAQIPVFFALYRMLYEAIELRHAPFIGWINDLSAPDRLFHFGFSIPFMEPPYGVPVLTLIMGVTMFIQQKLQPPPGDPMQAKMMMFLPIVFTVIFINFSAGLVLYWLVNNLLSIAQQHYVIRKNS